MFTGLLKASGRVIKSLVFKPSLVSVFSLLHLKLIIKIYDFLKKIKY